VRLATALAALLLPAAAPRAQDPEQVRSELAAAQQQLQRAGAETDRLFDLRMRLDLGLPVDELPAPAAAPATAPELEQARRRFAEADRSTAGLLARYQQLRDLVEQLQADAQQRAAQQRPGDEWIAVPVPGAPAPTQPTRTTAGAGDTHVAPAPIAESAPATLRAVPNLEPIQARIHGSSDHARVAQALFRAGQALMDRAEAMRGQGQAAAADDLDRAAAERLLRAVAELGESVTSSAPPFADLFYLGKCRELLFRLAELHEGLSPRADPRVYQRREQEVRDPFLAITARDLELVNGNQQPGAWGRAAQAAMEHFRWMNLHAGFAPKTPLDSITWPGLTEK
jgi:hypothetical protein